MTRKDQLSKIWAQTLNKLSSEINNPLLFHDAFLPAQLSHIQDDELYIVTPDEFSKNQFIEKQEIVIRIFNDLADKNFHFNFILEEELNNFLDTQINNLNQASIRSSNLEEISLENQNLSLEPQFSQNNIITGSFNKDVCKALNMILETGEYLFNPIYIHSDTGLGKTHLVSAFANEYIKKYPLKKLIFKDSSHFIKEVSMALFKSSNAIEQLKNEYFSADVFILEDFQFLSDKKKNCEIFFNLINESIRQQRLLIITAHTEIKQLVGFDDNILSRLSSGISLKIKLPEPDALKNIVIKELQKEKLIISDEALNLLVNYFNNDIRKLKGVINKIFFFTKNQDEFNNQLIDEKLLTEILDLDNSKDNKNIQINPNSVINEVARAYNLKPQDIIGKSRVKTLTLARHIVMFILRESFNFNLKEIGTLLGNRDHTTVINGVNKVKNQINSDSNLAEYIANIVKSL